MSKFRALLAVVQIVVVVFGLYLLISLLDLWAFLPFWVKNLVLIICLGATYWLSRSIILKSRKQTLDLHNKPWALPMASILVLGGLVWAGNATGAGLPGRILQAITFNFTQPPNEILLTVHVTPPDYINQSAVTIYDPDDGPVSGTHSRDRLTFPEGSLIVITVDGAQSYAPYISLGNRLGKNRINESGSFETRHVLQENAMLDIKIGPYISIRQDFEVLPDEAPEIKLTSAPETTVRQSLEFQVAYSDDHGIDDAYIEFYPRGGQRNERDSIRLSVNSDEQGPKTEVVYINLLSHQWAGTNVTGVIRAIDDLGQIGESEKITFALPEKTFQNPVAQSLAAIRKSLLITPERKNAQVRRLDILTNDRAAYQNNLSIYLSLRSAYWKLRSAETTADLAEVTRYLWQNALRIEDDGSFAEQNIQSLISQIRTGLASDESLAELDIKVGALRSRMETIVDREYLLLSKRMTMNDDLQEARLPGFIVFNTLLSTLRKQVSDGKIIEAGKTLTIFQALFEKRPAPSF